MTEKPYTKREIDMITKPIIDHLDKQDAILTRIEIQTTKTNGRVTSQDIWIKAIKWTLGILVTIIIAGVPLLRYVEMNDIKTISHQEFEAVLNERCGTPCVTPQK